MTFVTSVETSSDASLNNSSWPCEKRRFSSARQQTLAENWCFVGTMERWAFDQIVLPLLHRHEIPLVVAFIDLAWAGDFLFRIK